MLAKRREKLRKQNSDKIKCSSHFILICCKDFTSFFGFKHFDYSYIISNKLIHFKRFRLKEHCVIIVLCLNRGKKTRKFLTMILLTL